VRLKRLEIIVKVQFTEYIGKRKKKVKHIEVKEAEKRKV